MIATNAVIAVRNGLIATAVDAEDRVSTRAYLRSITNLGIGLGSALAGIGRISTTRFAYLTLIYADALSFAASAVLVMRLPRVPRLPRVVGEGPLPVAVRRRSSLDRCVEPLLCIHNGPLEIAVPLWIVRHTSAPRVMVAVIFAQPACCSVPASRGIHHPVRRRALRRSGALFLVSCVIYGLAGGRSAGVAIVLLVVAELAHVSGELRRHLGHGATDTAWRPMTCRAIPGLFTMSYSIEHARAGDGESVVSWRLLRLAVDRVDVSRRGRRVGAARSWAEANRPTRGAVMQGL